MGHAESVQTTYDPSQKSFGQLLEVYFSVSHDPTELNRRGPDEGTPYRSGGVSHERGAEAHRGGIIAPDPGSQCGKARKTSDRMEETIVEETIDRGRRLLHPLTLETRAGLPCTIQ